MFFSLYEINTSIFTIVLVNIGMSVEKVGMKDVEDFIKYLEGASISYHVITNINAIKDIITLPKLNGILDDTFYRWLKWFNKRGRQLGLQPDSEVSIRTLRGFFRKAFLEVIHRHILGYYGITGGDIIKYNSLGYRVSKLSLKLRGDSLAKAIEKSIREWELKHNVNEKIAKTIALASAQATVYLELKGRELLKPLLTRIPYTSIYEGEVGKA